MIDPAQIAQAEVFRRQALQFLIDKVRFEKKIIRILTQLEQDNHDISISLLSNDNEKLLAGVQSALPKFQDLQAKLNNAYAEMKSGSGSGELPPKDIIDYMEELTQFMQQADPLINSLVEGFIALLPESGSGSGEL